MFVDGTMQYLKSCVFSIQTIFSLITILTGTYVNKLCHKVQVIILIPRFFVKLTGSQQNWIANLDTIILEVDYDPENAYRKGHIPGAHLVWWKKDINDGIRRDIISKKEFEKLMSRVGANSDSTLVLYGDFNNWFAAFAFWVFKYYGHTNIKIMNGGRKKWELEKRTYSTDQPENESSNYIAKPIDEGIRAYLQDVSRVMKKAESVLVDVQIPQRIFRRNHSTS